MKIAAFFALALCSQSVLGDQQVLTNAEWQRIDASKHMTSAHNQELLIDYCIKDPSNMKWMHKLGLSTIQKSCAKKYAKRLNQEYQAIASSTAPYFDGIIHGRPDNYYFTLINTFKKDINQEGTLLKLASSGYGCDQLVNLLNISVKVGLNVDAAWILRQNNFHRHQCLERILQDFRVEINEVTANAMIESMVQGQLYTDALPLLMNAKIMKALTPVNMEAFFVKFIDTCSRSDYTVLGKHEQCGDFMKWLLETGRVRPSAPITTPQYGHGKTPIEHFPNIPPRYARFDYGSAGAVLNQLMQHPDFDWNHARGIIHGKHAFRDTFNQVEYGIRHPVDSNSFETRQQDLNAFLAKTNNL